MVAERDSVREARMAKWKGGEKEVTTGARKDGKKVEGRESKWADVTGGPRDGRKGRGKG